MILQGDCLELMKDIESGSVDAIITDPPYGTTACAWDSIIPFEPMWEQLNRIIKPNGAIVLFGSEPFSSALRMSNIKNYKYDWKWKKEKGVGFTFAKFMPLRQIEDIMIFEKQGKRVNYYPQMTKLDKPYSHILPRKKAETLSNCNIGTCKNGNKVYKTYTHKHPTNIIEVSRESNRNKKLSHPTQKPVALMEYLIKTYTNEGETVLDFTMGSCSTGVACQNTNRKFIGIELDETYFKIAQERLNNVKNIED